MTYYKLSEEQLLDLLEDAAFLRALQSAGVDNWGGFDFAQEIFQDEFNEEEIPYETI